MNAAGPLDDGTGAVVLVGVTVEVVVAPVLAGATVVVLPVARSKDAKDCDKLADWVAAGVDVLAAVVEVLTVALGDVAAVVDVLVVAADDEGLAGGETGAAGAGGGAVTLPGEVTTGAGAEGTGAGASRAPLASEISDRRPAASAYSGLKGVISLATANGCNAPPQTHVNKTANPHRQRKCLRAITATFRVVEEPNAASCCY